jgi:hypothetical protein
VAERIRWPEGKDFAFTIFDDTDHATLENVRPVYEYLGALGLHTTKSIWPIAGSGTPRIGGQTCDDEPYRTWLLEMQSAGFEIASHGATYETSTREQVLRALDRFREIFGHDPYSFANHADCGESIYWGEARTSGVARAAYELMTGFQQRGSFRGHVAGDPLFWGDVCLDRVRYVRNFTFRDINTLAACPVMPYHDPERPYVNAWFAASEGANVQTFNGCLSEAHQDRLEEQGGASIMYTHLASGFLPDGHLDPRFKELMARLARKNGWFVPVATLLDYLADRRDQADITPAQRRGLEWRWLVSKGLTGRT